jgi:flagellar basal-body rod protein FlgF
MNQDNVFFIKHGLPVLADGGPITVNPEQGELTVASDESISKGGNPLGRLNLYDFDDSDQLTRVEGGFFEAPEGTNP